MSVNSMVAELLRELRGKLRDLYGNRLVGVYLFGSFSRGEEGPESDLDVLIVLDPMNRYAGEVDLTGEIVSDLSLKYGVAISRTFVSRDLWDRRELSFLRAIEKDAIPA
ncbi:MAG: nucleotidyltransferase domain-containing protein [Candidatus Omnitrophica bacterium]|nr:hypothetical protein [bacterium]NUN97970.1 nucleotidyltransferase domain-containing protein [Candidatus Omnitrophota bacterium]